jgi:hypothetical protein
MQTRDARLIKSVPAIEVKSTQREAATGTPLPVVVAFSIAMASFMAQAIAPQWKDLPVHAILTWGLFLWAVFFRPKQLKKSLSIFSATQWFAVSILAISILIRSVLDENNLLRFGQLLTGIVIALFGSLIVNDSRRRNLLLGILILTASLSGLISILQYLDVLPWLWQHTTYARIGRFIHGATGLEYSPVPYAYSVMGINAVIFVALVLYFLYRIRLLPFSTPLLLVLSILAIGGVWASQSRSGLLGIAVALLFGLASMKGPRPNYHMKESNVEYSTRRYTNPGRVLLVGYLTFTFVSLSLYYVLTAREQIALDDVRITTTWLSYFPVIWRHPLGVPDGADILTALDSAGSYEATQALIARAGRVTAPHNLVLTTGLSYGPMAMLALLTLYWSALLRGMRSLRVTRRRGNFGQAAWILLFIAANLAVITHSWFHNASIAMGEMRNWLWLGLLLATCRLTGNHLKLGLQL